MAVGDNASDVLSKEEIASIGKQDPAVEGEIAARIDAWWNHHFPGLTATHAIAELKTLMLGLVDREG